MPPPDGRPVKLISIVDEHTRECLGGLVDRSITGDRLIDELDHLAMQRGYPRCCAATTDPNSRARRWPNGAPTRVGLAFIPPGEPWRNGYICEYQSVAHAGGSDPGYV